MKISREILRITTSDRTKINDEVAIESVYKFHINRKMVYNFLCSPSDIEALSIGYLFVNRYISSFENIERITIRNDIINADIIAQEIPDLKDIQASTSISTKVLTKAMNKLNHSGKTYEATGGTHTVGLFKNNKILFHFEDISRHNALMKVIGQAVKENINFSSCALLLSCRITFSIIDMLVSFPINIICSQSAVTDLAIEKAERAGKSVTGFVRNGRMNLYTGTQRFI